MVIEGVIRPPPEIRAIVEKTATYVAKNGRAFEARILGSGKGKTPKFAFLHQSSPFHAYYEERIKFFEEGGVVEEEEKETKEDDQQADGDKKKKAGQPKDDDDAANGGAKEGEEKKEEKADYEEKKRSESKKSSAAIDPVEKALLKQRLKIAQARAQFEEEAKKLQAQQQPPPPPPVQEGVPPPPPPPPPPRKNYVPPAPTVMELVEIVAPSSLTLAQIETIQLAAQYTALEGKGGPFFARLSHREWSNPQFGFLQPRHGHFAYFSALVDAYRKIFDTWTSGRKDIDNVAERANDAHKCLELAAYRVEYERDMKEQARKQREDAGDGIPEVAQIDWHDFVVVETIDFPADEMVDLAMMPPPPPSTKTSAKAATALNSALGNDLLSAGVTTGEVAGVGGDMDESDEEDDGETIRVVPSYTPKVVSAQEANIMDEVIDPITGKSVAVKDMPEHMRIQLLDPKWAEERKKFQEKQKDSNLVSGDVVASNISRLARDTSTGYDLLSGETDAKKRLEEANRIIREQSQRGVGPSLPPPVPPPVYPGQAGLPPPPPPPPAIAGVKHPSMAAPEDEPDAKRQQLETSAMSAVLPPPPMGVAPPPPPPDMAQQQASEESVPAENAGKEQELLPADEFIKTLSKPEVNLQVRVPNDSSQMSWNFFGQIVSLVIDCKSKVKAVKEELSKQHLNGMPANKIQLKGPSGFLKDSMTLAALNIGPTATLDMTRKTRGGRK